MRSEVKTVGALALLYAFRMLGLFMVVPVLAIFGAEYAGATPSLLGLALGVAGFTQALFLIPLGLLSDRFNRKFVIAAGFAVFALGSLVAALSSSIEGLILGRILQGAGAIGGAILALVADLTSEEIRTRSMAAVGASIGVSFAVAMMLGPFIAGAGGLAAVFFLACGLALLAIAVLYLLVPNPSSSNPGLPSRRVSIRVLSLAAEPGLASLNHGIFTLHAIFTGCMMVVPTLLRDVAGIPAADHWFVYVPTLVMTFILILPVIVAVERKQKIRPALITAVAILTLSLTGLMLTGRHGTVLLLTLFLLFLAFNFLEATLPSLMSKSAPADAKGSVMGVFTTCQSLGIFVGGFGAGILLEQYGQIGVFAGGIALTLIWLIVAGLTVPGRKYTDHRVVVPPGFEERSAWPPDQIGLNGIKQMRYVKEESAVYLKVDESKVDPRQLQSLLASLEE